MRINQLGKLGRFGLKGTALLVKHGLNYYARKYVLRRRHLVRKIHDYKLLLDLRDPGLSRDVAIRGSREEQLKYIIDRVVGPGDVVLDVGANIGYYAIMLAKRVGSSGKVYAMEPEPHNLELLQRNIDLNGVDGVMPVGFQNPENRKYAGKRLTEIAKDVGKDWVDTVFELLLSEEQRISTVYFMMSEENVQLQLQQPWIKVSTDAGGVDPAWAKENGPVHPRGYGTYPRVLGKYMREEGILTLEDTVRKMSSAVADRLGLRDRGHLRRGMAADVVVFDPETIGDRATFDDPHQLSVGVQDVWVNGTRVVADGTHTGATPGQIVEGPGG